MRYPAKMHKKWGQHFLIDEYVIEQIINNINPQISDHLVEIGPGAGAITKFLINKVALFDAVEIDNSLASALQKKYTAAANVHIHSADVLNFNFQQLIKLQKIRICGNLPYNIASQIIMQLTKYQAHINDMIFMLQQEVVDSLVAQPGHKTYTRLSVMAQYHYQTNKLLDIAPQAFYPPPKVNSSLIKLRPIIRQTNAKQKKIFSLVVKTAFNQKRKTINNSLAKLIQPHDLDNLNINRQLRVRI